MVYIMNISYSPKVEPHNQGELFILARFEQIRQAFGSQQ